MQRLIKPQPREVPDMREWLKGIGFSDPEGMQKTLSEYRRVEKKPEDPLVVMVLGPPAVGKSTIIKELHESDYGINFMKHGVGSKMLEIAKAAFPDRVKVRDDMRKKLTEEEHQKLQHDAVFAIGTDCREGKHAVHLLDCHITTKEKDKILFGLPPENFHEYNPDLIILMDAPSEVIQARRMAESGKRRRETDIESIRRQKEANYTLLNLISQMTGVPFKVVNTVTTEDIPHAAEEILKDALEAKPPYLYSVSPKHTYGTKKLPTSEALLSPEFHGTLDEKMGIMSALSQRVVDAATLWSTERGMPAFVLNNMEAGRVYKFAFPHWSTQMETREDALEFAEKAKATDFWREMTKLNQRADETEQTDQKFASRDAAILRKQALAQHDLAILSTAKEFLDAGRIKSFVLGVCDTRVHPESNEPWDEGLIKARASEVAAHPDVLLMVADSCNMGRCKTEPSRYGSALLGSGLNEFLGRDVEEKGDWVNEKALFLDPSEGGFIITRPNTDIWWNNIPEITYPAHKVQCDTNLGPMELKQFLKWSIRRQTGWVRNLKGWEAEADKVLHED